MKKINICFSPEMFHLFPDKNSVVVVVDILRATSSICSALYYGVKEIIPVASLYIAKKYKTKGYLVAAERDGKIVSFADFGNSPLAFNTDKIRDKTIVFCSTNGTPAIKKAENYRKVILGSFLNVLSVKEYLVKQKQNIIISCSGWKGNFSMEDALFGGYLINLLEQSGVYKTETDAGRFAKLLWNIAHPNLLSFLDDAEHVKRLRKIGAVDDIKFCIKQNIFNIIPELQGDKLISINP